MPPTNDLASQIVDVVRDDLESRYGEPFWDRATSDDEERDPSLQALWFTPEDETMRGLKVEAQKDGAHTGVTLYYSKWEP